MSSIGSRIIDYLRYAAVKPVVVLIIIQFAVFLPCYVLLDSLNPAAHLCVSDAIWQGEIWRPFTALFTEVFLLQFIIGALVFYLLGRWFLSALSRKEFYQIIFIGGMLANIAHVLLFDSVAFGFRGAFNGLLVAATIRQPKTLIFIFPAWLFVSVFLFLDVLNFLNSLRPDYIGYTGYGINVFGALFGAALMYALPHWNKLRAKWHREFLEKEKLKHADELKRVDEILEKISQHGLTSISEEERLFLKRHSDNERKRN